MSTLALVGYGYTGERIAAAWPGRVVAVSRSAPSDVPANAPTLSYVQSSAAALDTAQLPALDAAVITFGTRSARVEDLAHVVRVVAERGARRVIYVSSTSVYGGCDGAEVDDESPRVPDTAMGRRRVEAEDAFADAVASAGVSGASVRLPGIYGPGRTIRRRLLDGSYRYPREEKARWTNRIHVDDVATAVLAALDGSARAYLAADGHPFRAEELVAWSCEQLGLPVPEPVPFSEISPRAQPFWTSSRRCVPRRLLAAGWTPRYPTFREGLLASWAAEDAAAQDAP